MTHEFTIVIERDACGLFVASVPALPGCHTQADTQDALMPRIREAIALHLEERGEDLEPMEFIAVERVTVAARAWPLRGGSNSIRSIAHPLRPLIRLARREPCLLGGRQLFDKLSARDS